MDKIIKNTTVTDIDVASTGATVPASGQITIDRSNYNLWATEDTITEVTTAVNAGDLVVNNGDNDLNAADGLEYLSWFVSEAAHDDFILRDTDNPVQTVRMRTTGTFGGFTLDKPNGASGFLSYMPNSQFPQITAGDPAAGSGVNQFFLDADNSGTLNLNVLPGAGQFGEVNVSCNAPVRPDVDIKSPFGKFDKRWEKHYSSGNRHRINQTAHGFTLPSYGVIPVYYNNLTSNYEPANADDTEKAADALIVDVIDVDNFEIQEGGYLFGTHGLEVGEWYVLRAGLAGLIHSLDTHTGENVQYLLFVIDDDTLVLRIDPMFVEASVEGPAITRIEDWSQGVAPPTPVAGTNRMLQVNVNWEDNVLNGISSLTIGGQTTVLVVEQTITSGFSQGAHVLCLTEAEIAAMVGTSVVINWTNGTPASFQTSFALFENVNQTSPIVGINSDSGTGSTDTMDADINTEVDGWALMVCSGGNSGMGFTNNGTGFVRELDLVIPSADGVVDDKMITVDAMPENMNMSVTGSNRHVLVCASYRKA